MLAIGSSSFFYIVVLLFDFFFFLHLFLFLLLLPPLIIKYYYSSLFFFFGGGVQNTNIKQQNISNIYAERCGCLLGHYNIQSSVQTCERSRHVRGTLQGGDLIKSDTRVYKIRLILLWPLSSNQTKKRTNR